MIRPCRIDNPVHGLSITIAPEKIKDPLLSVLWLRLIGFQSFQEVRKSFAYPSTCHLLQIKDNISHILLVIIIEEIADKMLHPSGKHIIED